MRSRGIPSHLLPLGANIVPEVPAKTFLLQRNEILVSHSIASDLMSTSSPCGVMLIRSKTMLAMRNKYLMALEAPSLLQGKGEREE